MRFPPPAPPHGSTLILSSPSTGHCPASFDLCRPCLVDRNASELARHNPSHVFLELKDSQSVDLALLKEVTRYTSRRPRGLLEWDLYA